MRYAVIENGVVVNVVEAVAPLGGLTMVPAATAQIGWTYAGGAFSPPPAPPPQRWRVLRGTIVDRLIALGLDDAAEAALASFPAALRRRWESRWWVWSDDPEASALLTAISAPVATILAFDPDAPRD